MESQQSNDQDVIKCPYCGSHQVISTTKGFSAGKAAAGGLLLGPIGLLAGAHHSNEVKFLCCSCGEKFSLEELQEAIRKEKRQRELAAMSEEERQDAHNLEQFGKYMGITLCILIIIILLLDL